MGSVLVIEKSSSKAKMTKAIGIVKLTYTGNLSAPT